MASFEIPYGRGTMALSVADEQLAGVLRPREAGEAPSLEGQAELVRRALREPIGGPRLSEIARGKRRALVITSDHTRPVPSRVTMPLLLQELRAGSPDIEVRILLATGMHRAATPEEIADKLGGDIAARERVINHDCRKDAMVDKGELPSGGRLILNALVDWADLIVAEGFIEPHFFAGFSGGRKSILPGIASEQTVRYNHNARFIADPSARSGVLEGNPIHRDMAFAVRASGLAFILNVLIDGEKNIVDAVAGDPILAHERGCLLCLDRAAVAAQACDICVTSNGGYPLDQNIYQAVKGMTAAEACVRPGGVIVIAAECLDGHGGGNFFRDFAEMEGPEALLERFAAVEPGETPADQWQSQILARVMTRASVIFVTGEANRETIERMHMRWAADMDDAMAQAYRLAGRDARAVVIPDGVGVIVR